MRYRLRTLLIVVAVVGVIVGSYVMGTRLRRAERELQVLRDETGRLTIGDRSQVHVINVPVADVTGDEPKTWRWRLFIPKGQKYSWNLAAKDIPQLDVPEVAGVKRARSFVNHAVRLSCSSRGPRLGNRTGLPVHPPIPCRAS